MASLMLTAEMSASGSTESDVDKALKAALHTCANDPDFAVICDFLQKFSKDLGLDLPNFKLLLQWLAKTDEVTPQLRDMQIKLLRKTRKTVHEKSWESALSKFCFTYSAQDGWEIERFGYKNSNVKVKLRILRELLECQFERNTKFRAKILTLSADSLRSQPIGRDRQGHSYWVTQDNDCNIHIYQEHLDEEIWRVVATNREEFVNLIKRLRGSEVVQPCKDISIVDEDTSNSSHIDSDAIQKILPTVEKDDSQEDEQKVPKLSIKLVHGKSSNEAINEKYVGKGEEELAAEEDAKLLKKSNSCSETIDSGEDKFEEEYDDESGSEPDSEEEVNERKHIPKKIGNVTEQKSLNSKTENKKVKPLLISQNKVLKNNKCPKSSMASKKRTLEQINLDSPFSPKENTHIKLSEKSRPILLDSKRTKTFKTYEDNKDVAEDEDFGESDEDFEKEEGEEEDIDSVAAEEDENEEKMFEDYDDDDEEEVGEEICDPVVRVTGEGAGKECNIGNYLCFIDYDLYNESVPILSEEIVEKVYYIRENGNGKECLVGNKNNDNVINLEEKTRFKTNVEEKSESSSKISSPQKEKTSSLENIDTKLNSLVKNDIPTEDNLNDTTKLNEDLDAKEKINNKNSEESHKKDNEAKEAITLKEDVSQINGQTKSNAVTSKIKSFNEKQLDSTKAAENIAPSCDKNKLSDETFSKAIYKKDIQITDENRKNSNSLGIDVITKQTEHDNKMSALESVKKELRESKQKLLEKKLPQTSESCNVKISSLPVYNRKRRLTDQLQTAFTRPQNSESEIDLNLENADELVNDKDLDAGYSGENVGGKRLKSRSKQANTELRKKIEAQKVSAYYENTSSSSGGEEMVKRKKISPKHHPHSESEIKSEIKPKNCQSKIRNDPKYDENITQIEENSKYGTLSQKPVSLKKGTKYIPSKVKPTLAEIIEKKLKKTPEKSEQNIGKKISSLNKSPITKPLKKNLLTYTKQEESDEDAIPQKCTNSQGINSIGLNDIATSCEINVEKQKNLRERQRKRRSNEETIQNDSPAEPEAKKEITVIRENIIIKSDKLNETMRDGVIIQVESKGCEIQNESLLPISGRRSGRRSNVITTYVDNLQKAKRSSTKSILKKHLIPSEKDEKFEKIDTIEIKSSDNLTSRIADKTIEEKPLLKEIYKNEDKTKKNEISLKGTKSKSCSAAKTPGKGGRKQREVDATNIIDIDSETPVRQSRRIAQQKIREEAERRKLEEIALRTMKQELKKKKKAEKQCDPTVVPPTEPSSESEESDIAIKKKVQKKKCPGKNGNWSSGSEEQEEPEEEDEEAPHYETDPGSPLFKSDHEFSPESDIEDESQVVPMKRARTVRKEDADTDAVVPNEEEEACQKCNKSDHPEWILLCDNCDKGYHCSCLSPVLFYIPEGDWYCPPCQQEQLIKALENQLKEFDDLVENKKKAEEQAKLKAEEEKARQEREEETNKQKSKKNKNKKAIRRRHNDSSSAEDHSREEGDNEEATSNSNESKHSGSNKQSSMNRNRSRNSKNRDKRNYHDRRHNVTRSRRNKFRKHNNFISDSHSTSAESDSDTNSTFSSAYSESDNEPIYKLRKRRQINVSYRLNEYDDLINSALKKEMDEAAGAGNLGRGKDISTIIEADKEEKARQKQIEDCEVVGKPKEVKNDESVTEQNNVTNEANNDEKIEVIKKEENDSDTEPIIRKLNIKPSQKKKARKLTTLDISSEGDDGSDEDFKGSSFDEEEEDTSISASNSDSSLEIYKRHGKFKKKRRKAARRAFRERRRDRRFLADDSDDEVVHRPKSKKKRKDDSDYTESEAEDDISELSENIDSADLCDDTTTDESDCAWRPNKRKKAKKSTNTSFLQKSSKAKSVKVKKSRKIEYSDYDISESEDEDDEENEEVDSGKGMGKQPRSQPLKTVPSSTKIKVKGKVKEKPLLKAKRKNSSEEGSSQSDSEDSTRRTRGRRYAYIEDFDDDSSDGGIKPGVQRPDTPPEEREKFIKRQEEIKRMLAEKNAEGAKLVATPRLTPIKTECELDKRSPVKTAGDSLSTVPLSVIRQAKVLDIDYLQKRGENLDDLSAEVGVVDDDFDDADLPDDLPEDMDEDAIARMVEEEEEFGVATAKDLPAPDEILRTPAMVKPTKIKDVEKLIFQGSTSSSQLAHTPLVTQVILPTSTSALQEPVRKRLPMPTMHPPLLRHQFLMQDTIPSTQHLMQRHGNAPTSHLLQNALSAPLTQPIDRNYPSTPHHSLINRMTHGIHLQSTVPHTLSTTRVSQPPASSTVTKSPSQINQLTQEKPLNSQSVTQSKPRGRRKKITPLRDTLQKQQTAAAVTAATATSSALASSLVKNNDPLVGSILPSVIKSDSTPKLPIQACVITSMPPASHSGTSRPGMPISAISGSYVRTDGPRFYDTLENRISQSSTQRHRVSTQMPPSLLPSHPANRSSYGLPPPLKGSSSGPVLSSLPTPSGSIGNPIRHVPPPYLGIPPNARHASHLNMYRPPMFNNPNFGPRVNLRPSNIHSPDYAPGSRTYPPYSFYPPPPPLTTPGQRSTHSSLSRPPIQMPPVQTALTHPASVIVSTASSKLTNALTVIPQSAPPSTTDITDSVPSSKAALITQESQIKSAHSKSSSPPLVTAQPGKVLNTQLTVTEPRKKLTTLQAYVANSAKKSPVLPTSDSSESRSPLDRPTDVNDESSAPGITENISTDEPQTRQEGQASEFSGLVSYFSSQHNDYNT